jgi:hypothetical protein
MFSPPQFQTPALSFGIEKHIIDTLSHAEEVSDQHFTATIAQAFSLAHPEKVTARHLSALVQKVVDRINSLQTPDKPQTRSYNKSLGTNYATWLSELNAVQVCFYLADYDPIKAETYYWFSDILVVQEAVKLKAQHDNQLALIAMEAALYGAGGKYEGDSGGDEVKNHDMDSADMARELKAFGF